MKKTLIPLFAMLLVSLLFSGCTSMPSPQAKKQQIMVSLVNKQGSDFKQVEAQFTVKTDKATAFRVISNLNTTTQWLSEVSSITSLKMYDYNHFLVRTILNSPWPFQQRELISCINTTFTPQNTTINVTSCSASYATSDEYVRVTELESHWTITPINVDEVKVTYRAWLDPQGHVPAIFFNNALKTQTDKSLKRLQTLILAETNVSD